MSEDSDCGGGDDAGRSSDSDVGVGVRERGSDGTGNTLVLPSTPEKRVPSAALPPGATAAPASGAQKEPTLSQLWQQREQRQRQQQRQQQQQQQQQQRSVSDRLRSDVVASCDGRADSADLVLPVSRGSSPAKVVRGRRWDIDSMPALPPVVVQNRLAGPWNFQKGHEQQRARHQHFAKSRGVTAGDKSKSTAAPASPVPKSDAPSLARLKPDAQPGPSRHKLQRSSRWRF